MLKFFKGKDKGNLIYAPCKGRVVPLAEVPDPVFADKVLGDGFAVIPADGRIYAPADGEVAMVFDTLHAVIIHPAVKQRILRLLGEQKEAGRGICVVEAALFLEENYQEFCDEVWYVYTEEEIRIQRLMESRGYSREKSLGIIRNQVSDQVFREHTDYVIENNGDLSDTRRQIREGIERNETL